MFTCLFCGLESSRENARSCSECGPDGPAKDWASEDVDQPAKVTQYASLISEQYFNTKDGAEFGKYSVGIRKKFKISFGTHSEILSKLAEQKETIAQFLNFRLEFNENVIDAYAGHDTFLNFRYTNLAEDGLLKLRLFWDDPDTTERVDLKAETKSWVKPNTPVTIGARVIFDRIGVKEISDLTIIITDQFGGSARFRAEPIVFNVGSHDQKITQNISTHNQISIEGRGVVDASGMGAEKFTSPTEKSSLPRWRELICSYIHEVLSESLSLETTEKEIITKTSVIEFDKGNLQSILVAAEKRDADTQKTTEPPPASGPKTASFMSGVYQMPQVAKFGTTRTANAGQHGLADDDALLHTTRREVVRGPAEPDDMVAHKLLPKTALGTDNFTDGNKYVGEYKDGTYNGQGTFTFADGDEYTGEFKDGEYNGQGTFTCANGNKYVGEFKDGKYNGLGTFAYANGDKYVGEFKDGRLHGWGESKLSGEWSGHEYLVHFVNGLMHGHVKHTNPNGETDFGVYEEGLFVAHSDEETFARHRPANKNYFNSVEGIILHYATKKIAAMQRIFYIDDSGGLSSPKFRKKIQNFSQSFSKSHFKEFDPEVDTPILFYDGTILGSGKDGIVFTAKSIYAAGCLGRGVKIAHIEYGEINNVRMTTDKMIDKEIFIESAGHLSMIVLRPSYATHEDILFIVEMLEEIQRHSRNRKLTS